MSSTQNWLKKGLKLVSLVLMVVERWGTLRWRILLWHFFSESWNSSSMLWRHDLKIISKRLGVRLKSGTRISLVQKIFFIIANLWHTVNRVWICAEPEFRLSWIELCSIDTHYTTAPKFTWSGQNLHLRCVFSTSWNWRCWSLLQLATLQKIYFQGCLFLQNTIRGSL